MQVGVITISHKSAAYGRRVWRSLLEAGLRAELDDSDEKVGPKKHRMRARKVPYILVVGEQEAADQTVNVNDAGGAKLGNVAVKQFVQRCLEEIAAKGKQ